MAALKAAFALAALLPSAAACADPLDRWAAEIGRASARFGIPEPWIRRVIRAESGGQALIGGRPVVSRAGAMGLMQLMPGTWRDMRAVLGLGSDPNDPADNIAAGTLYLRLMYERFGYPGLFAAYNAGPARYSAVLSGRRRLPSETRAYVAAVAGAGPPPPETPRAGARWPIAAAQRTPAQAAADDSLRPSSDGLFIALDGAPDREAAEERARQGRE